ncbi:MAG TPA: hypothetical protein PKE36_06965 [Chiayiivirga sp.]|nr:hypothetical protein [Chiayiivirga sp.]
MRMIRILALAPCLLLAAACSRAPLQELPVEVLVAAPLALDIETQGQVRAVRSTPLVVPGRNWTRQQLTELAPDGSAVKQGQVIARFSAAQGELQLTEALLEIQRNALTRAGKQETLDSTVGRLEVDLAQVDSDLAIASRYADADLTMFARNQILDAIQDRAFLDAKDDTLRWRLDQASDRGSAELAVVDAQAATYQHTANLRREDLSSLELIAPHDGVLVLEADWSGDKPTVGSTLWAQNELGSLPDTSTLELQVSIPQLDAHDVEKGLAVSVHPLGHPEQITTTTLEFVANAAQAAGRDNPVRYLKAKAPLPAEAAQRWGWVPGQAFRAVLHLNDGTEPTLSVPNVALRSDAGQSYVYVVRRGEAQRRDVETGARGPARTRIVSGLAAGDAVLLLPDALERADAGGATTAEAAP